MEKLITYENLRNYAYVNDKLCKDIKGIIISFFGLNATTMFFRDTEEGKFWAEQNILLVVPYNNPWAWMNSQAVAYTDEILDVIFEKYHLPEKTPIVSSGGSMGGQSALVYTKYAKRTPIACVANCPVCDVVYHFTERQDLPRTFYSAYFYEQGTMEDALKNFSPLHMVNQMPKVRYHIFHCGADEAVNIDSHSRKFVEAMKIAGQQISFDIVPGRGHVDLTEEMWDKYRQYGVDAIKNYYENR